MAAATAVAGIGTGVAMAPAVDAVMSVLPPERAGVGIGLNQTVRQIGSALGVALLGSVLSGAYAARVPAAAKDSLAAALQLAERLPGPRCAALQDAAQRAFIHGMDVVLLVCAGAMLTAAVLVTCFLAPRT